MPTLYQKYRPQYFKDLIGQEHIVQTISNEIKNNKLAHAYLFFGPRGIGKTTLARLLAKSLNCEQRQNNEYESCNKCNACEQIAKSRHIDVIEIDAASNTGVDNVRENIIENAQFRPTKAKYKVFIIDEVHMLSTSAFNALLKTLEEPPQHIIFVLATTELHKLPATIISRCQRFNFKKISHNLMLKRLKKIADEEKVKIDKKVLVKIINKSDGCLRDAESLLGQILSLNLKTITNDDATIILPTSNVETVLQFVNNIKQKQSKAALELLQQITDEGVNLEQFAYDLLELLRLLMILQTNKDKNIQLDYSDKDIKTIKKMASDFSSKQLIDIIEAVIVRKQEIKTSPIPQLPLELLVVKFTSEQSEQMENMENSEQTNDLEQKKIVKTKIDEQQSVTRKNQYSRKITKIKDKISSLAIKKPLKTNLDKIKTKWSLIIDKITEDNHSLGFILKMSEVSELSEAGLLTISVPYSLHKDKLIENKTKKIIEKNLLETFSEKITIDCQIKNSVGQTNKNKEDIEINRLAADFGGEVIT